MALKLPRTIRLDPSDTFVYARAAAPGEWAVTGTFLFYGRDAAGLSGKDQQAFRGGFLGIGSFGWSTLVVVTKASAEEREVAVARLAAQLVGRCGAPDAATARAAAEEEIAFARSLCDHPEGTLLAIHRSAEADGVRETFRTLHRRAGGLDPAQAFRFVEIDEEATPGEAVDLLALAKDVRR